MSASQEEFNNNFSELPPEFDFVADQKTPLPPASEFKSQIENGTFIVTGSNTGLGYEAALALVAQGAAKVILAVRSQSKGDDAVSRIEKATGVKGVAQVWILDMSSYASILAFGEKVQALDRLDGISENAAVAYDTFVTAGEKDIEITNMVNVLGTMLLAALVFPKLQETAKKIGKLTHLSIVGSGVAFQTDAMQELDLAVSSGKDIIDFFNDASRGVPARYPVSKLLLLHVLRRWCRAHPPSATGVVINFVNPGLCITELDRNVNEETQKALGAFRQQIGRTAEVGARTLVHGLFSGESGHAVYLSECVPKDNYVPKFISGEEGQRKEKLVWDSVVKHIDEIASGVLKL